MKELQNLLAEAVLGVLIMCFADGVEANIWKNHALSKFLESGDIAF